MRADLSESLWAVGCVFRRYFDVFKKRILYGVLTTFLEPILYLLSFGYGLGGVIGSVEIADQTVSYRPFIFAGIVAQTCMFQGFFEGAFGAFVRMYYQRIFKAMATTPVTLSEVLWGELLWDATKGSFAATVVLMIGVATGDFSFSGALICIPICFASSLCFSAMGLWTAGVSQTIEQISYPQFLLVFPMFLFCGVYFPLERLPTFLQTLAWCLPLTSVVSLIRTFTLDLPFEISAVFSLVFWTVFLVGLSRWQMLRRLVK